MILATTDFNYDTEYPVETYIDRNKIIAGVRVNLLKVGDFESGSIEVSCYYSNTLIEKKEISYSDLIDLGQYWHGMKAFNFDEPININKFSTDLNVKIVFKIKHTLYSSNSSYVSFIKEDSPTTSLKHLTDQPYYPTYGYNKSVDVWNNPYGFEVYTYA